MAKFPRTQEPSLAQKVATALGLPDNEIQVDEGRDEIAVNRVRWVQGPDANHWENGVIVGTEPTWYMEAEDLVLTPGQLTAVKRVLGL